MTFLGIMYRSWWKIMDFIFNKFQDRARAFIIIIIIIVASIYANVVPDGKEKKKKTRRNYADINYVLANCVTGTTKRFIRNKNTFIGKDWQ